MGLASYGEPNYMDQFEKLVKYDKKNLFNLNLYYYHAFCIKMFFRSLPFALLCQELFKRAAEDTLDVSHDLAAFQFPARFVESDVLVLQHGGDNCTAVLPFVQNLV